MCHVISQETQQLTQLLQTKAKLELAAVNMCENFRYET